MLTPRDALEKTLDAIGLLVKWSVTWGLALVIILTPLMYFGVQSDAIGAKGASTFFAAAMFTVLAIGALLALADLALRARSKGNVFLVIRTAWRTSRIAKVVSPIGAAVLPVVNATATSSSKALPWS